MNRRNVLKSVVFAAAGAGLVAACGEAVLGGAAKDEASTTKTPGTDMSRFSDKMMVTPNFVLLYRVPIAMKEAFIDFVKNGARDQQGTFRKDEHGNKMTGVIAWLRSNGMFDTKLYTAEADDHLILMATAASEGPDWADIPGFAERFGSNVRVGLRADLNDLLK